MPFSEEELAYIERLDPAADCELLRRELPALRPECGRTLQVATALLQAAAAAGLRCAARCPRRQLLCIIATPPSHVQLRGRCCGGACGLAEGTL